MRSTAPPPDMPSWLTAWRGEAPLIVSLPHTGVEIPDPAGGVHAIQMEPAGRIYMCEPDAPVAEGDWPAPYDSARAAPVRLSPRDILEACLAFAARPDAAGPHA